MRYVLIVILIVLFCRTAKSQGQTITGKVVNKETQLPLSYIFVTSSSGNTFTDEGGRFTIKIRQADDTVRIQTMSYKAYSYPVSGWGNFTRTIQLEPVSILLNEVKISAKKNYYKDSVSLRKEFAKEFTYTGPKLKDMLRPTSSNVPFAFMTIDLLSLYGMLTKKNNQQSRLKRALLKDEQARHIDQRFNKNLVARITNLQGDSLESFISNYRPTPAVLDKLTDYDLINYIKTNLTQFRTKVGRLDTLPVLLKPGQSLKE